MELEYKKIICDGGHELILLRDALQPQFCPNCNRRYDRRRTRAILCLKDGSVPRTDEEHAGNHTVSRARYEEDKDPAPMYRRQQEATENPDPMPVGSRRRGVEGPDPTLTYSRKIVEGYSESMPVYSRRRVEENPEPTSTYSRRRIAEDSDSTLPYSRRRVDERRAGRSAKETYTDVSHSRDQRESTIQIRSGADVIRIESEGAYLGREEQGCEFLSLNRLVSRRHAFVREDRMGGLQIQDENSLNGTFVDTGDGRRKLRPQEKAMLPPGSKFWLGDQLFIVES